MQLEVTTYSLAVQPTQVRFKRKNTLSPKIVNLNKVLSLHFINEAKRCEIPSESYKLRISLIRIPKSSLNCKAKFAILHVVKHIEKDRRMRTTDCCSLIVQSKVTKLNGCLKERPRVSLEYSLIYQIFDEIDQSERDNPACY